MRFLGPSVNFLSACVVLLLSARAANAGYTFSSFDLPGARQTTASGINNQGQIVGQAVIGLDVGFLYSGGTFTIINGASAGGINDAGQIVGFTSDVPGPATGYLYDNGTYTPIAVPGASSTYAYGINNSGQIVGHNTVGSDTLGFVRTSGIFETISFPGLESPSAINDAGQIVGDASSQTGNAGFLYANGAITPIAVPNFDNTFALGINDAGVVVGTYRNFGNGGANTGFILNDGVFTTLEVPGAFATVATGINDLGQVVGWYQNDDLSIHSFLATPVATPEAPTLAFFVLGLVAVGLRGVRVARHAQRCR